MRILPFAALLLVACATPRPPATEDGPLGPIRERRREGEAVTTQFRPFYFKREDHRGKSVNVLAPLVRYRHDEVFRRVQVFPFAYYTARHTPENEKSWFLILFPLAVFGTGDFLILPFGGYSNSLLGIDDLLLVTPFYLRTRFTRGPAADPVVYTVHHVLWPLIAWGSDGEPDGRRTLRFAPFWGKTKGRGGFEKGFVLWPFYTWRRTGPFRLPGGELQEGGKAFFFFPFYGRDVTPTRRHTTVMFPIYMRTVDNRTGLRDTTVFPFYRKATGSEATEVRRYWPFYQHSRDRWNVTTFKAWPVWRQQLLD
ncbi:MAG TPA: hypothetical protein VIC87_19135, partial [Vicinamibacteria bacterium]